MSAPEPAAVIRLRREDLGLSSQPEPARNPRQSRLLALWEEILEVDDIGVADDFFELGGDSFGVARLCAALERSYGHPFAPALFAKGMSVLKLERMIDGPQASAPVSTVIPIQSGATNAASGQITLLAIHGMGGEILFARNLAAALGPERPIYGIRAIGRDSAEMPPPTVSQIVSRYVADLRAAELQGPYHLLGICIGGIFAVELARQLTAAGEKVASLVIFDGAARVDPGWRAMLARTRRYSANVPLARRIFRLQRTALTALRHELRKLISGAAMIADQDERAYGPDRRPFITPYRLAAYRYRPTPTDLPALLLATDGYATGFEDETLGWSRYLADLTVIRVALRHGEVWQPAGLATIAERLQRWFRDNDLGLGVVPKPALGRPIAGISRDRRS